MGLFTPAGSAEGGAGGLLAGHEWRLGPAFIALNLWGGVGGLRSGDLGYLLVFGQADLEVGILWLPWMEITFYAGYQTWGNLFPRRSLCQRRELRARPGHAGGMGRPLSTL